MQAEIHVLQNVRLTDEEVLRAARLTDADEDDQARALEMRDGICAAGRPKYLLGTAKVTAHGADWVELDGTRFRSAALAQAFGGLAEVYPYLATCGTEAADWAKRLGDELEQYWANSLMYLLLRCAIRELDERLAALMPGKKTERLVPGTIPDWTLYGQRDLFKLFGEENIGVTLRESCLMVPENTISGCVFFAPEGFSK